MTKNIPPRVRRKNHAFVVAIVFFFFSFGLLTRWLVSLDVPAMDRFAADTVRYSSMIESESDSSPTGAGLLIVAVSWWFARLFRDFYMTNDWIERFYK
jgi:hypothetical protein